MAATKLTTICVEKPWGRRTLWPGFATVEVGAPPIGEIWFAPPDGCDPDLLVKYLFTSERLSIQVHPDDDAARVAGYERGKDEAWVVLAAEPDAVIGLGLKQATTREALYAAALDGSIVDLVDWRPVKAGDVLYSPAGTIHAIGAGVTVIEVQQSLDLTYRLYDYDRPRELHLDAGLAVSTANAGVDLQNTVVENIPDRNKGTGKTVLVDSEKFRLEHWCEAGAHRIEMPDDVAYWLIPVTGAGMIEGAAFTAGECWMLNGAATLEQHEGSEVLIALPPQRPTSAT